MSSVAPKTDLPLLGTETNEEELTSIMSADQRKALQRAASDIQEAEALDRDTARPPPSNTQAEALPAIPRAPGLPKVGRVPEGAALAPSGPVTVPEAAAAGLRWTGVVPFVLLAAAIVFCLR